MEKRVILNETGAWLLYRALAAKTLEDLLFKGNAWAFTECLDGSFDEIKDKPLEYWDSVILEDAEEYKKENPEDFETVH